MTTLDDLLLQRLAEWRPDTTPAVLQVAHPATGWSAALEADAVDGVGGRLRELVLTRSAPPAEGLQERAARAAATVTGLLEPLALVEVDAPRGVAQLRSAAPQRRGGMLSYYELTLEADGTTRLRRYSLAQAPGARREAVAFALTHEALAKLVADLTA